MIRRNLIFLTCLTFLVLQLSCTSSRVKRYENYWIDNYSIAARADSLLVGDIIIVERAYNPIGIFGHSAVVLADMTVGEYPKIGYGYWQGSIYNWLYNRDDMVVLRYRFFTPEFKKQFLENADVLHSGKYGITLSKDNDRTFYCSQYVWYLYYKTAMDLGYHLDIDSNGGIMAYPYDFFGNDDLIPITIEKSVPGGMEIE